MPSITVGGPTVTPVISLYHDANGNQTAEKDPDSNTTYYNFDHLNRLAAKREYVATGLDPSASPAYSTEIDAQALTSYLYDAAGNLTRTTTATDANDRVVGYEYNALGQLTSENWFANSTSTTASENTISYSYADAGELHTAVDYFGSGDSRNSAYAFTTNHLGWVTQVDNNDSSTTGTAGVPRVVLNAKYDLNGNRTALNAQVNVGSGLKDDFQNSYTFDRLNRETQVIQQAASTSGHYAVGYKKTAFAWDNDGRLQSLTDYKDSSTQAVQGSFGYDHDGRLTSLSWYGYGGGSGSGSGSGSSSGYFEQFGWVYDKDSHVQTFTNVVRTSENLTYQYDHDDQLTSAAGYYGGPYGGFIGGTGGGTYGWDGNGDSTLSGWVTGKGNRLLKDGTYRYEYDVAGHMTKRTALTGGAYTEYGWDERGRMISVTDKNSSGVIQQKIDLVYDAFNDLITRTVTPYSSGSPVTGSITSAHFVYDLTGTGTAVLAFDGNQSLTDRYLWGPAVDEILADERFSPSGSNVMPSSAGTVYWALTDNENTVRDWISYGSLVDHIVYDSFGKIDASHSTMPVPFAFGHNGVFYDPSSGLEWHSQPGTGIPGRWYNPATRRWMSEDPTGLAAGPDQYAYCRNSPTNLTDPSGLEDSPLSFLPPADPTSIPGSSSALLTTAPAEVPGPLPKTPRELEIEAMERKWAAMVERRDNLGWLDIDDEFNERSALEIRIIEAKGGIAIGCVGRDQRKRIEASAYREGWSYWYELEYSIQRGLTLDNVPRYPDLENRETRAFRSAEDINATVTTVAATAEGVLAARAAPPKIIAEGHPDFVGPPRPPAAAGRRAYLKAKFEHPDNPNAVVNTAVERNAARYTERLQGHVDRIAAEVDAAGEAAFSRPQVCAILDADDMQAAHARFRGWVIDKRVRPIVKSDPLLQHLDGRINFGPDFIDPNTRWWWDMTTPEEWGEHLSKYSPSYGTNGTLLGTH